MLTLRGVSDLPTAARGAVLAVGNFDGVHRGHQVLLRRAIEIGRGSGKPAAVMVFEPHPREFFQPAEPHFTLTPLPTKLEVFEGLGLDLAVVLDFDAALSKMTADQFIDHILVERLCVSHVVIGYDFFFGNRRSGTPDTMRAAGKAHGFGVSVVAPVAEDGEVFSSTAIRLKLAQGDVAGAAHGLGRWWSVAGTVVGGARRGTGLGFPTANVPMPRGTALGHGIYAVRVRVGEQHHDGAAYLGTRPTFDDGMPVLEVFLFDFDADLYGRAILVEFIAFIRPDRKFDTPEALATQMREDCAKAQGILATAPADAP